MVELDAIKNGIAAYAEREIINKMQTGDAKRLLAGTAIALCINRSSALMRKAAENKLVSALGVVGDGGAVDLDALCGAVLPQMPECGVKVQVPVLGELTFFSSDVRALYHDITGGDWQC